MSLSSWSAAEVLVAGAANVSLAQQQRTEYVHVVTRVHAPPTLAARAGGLKGQGDTAPLISLNCMCATHSGPG